MIFAQTAAVGGNNVPKYTPRPLNGVAPSQMQRQGEAHGTLLLLFLRYGVPPSTTESKSYETFDDNAAKPFTA